MLARDCSRGSTSAAARNHETAHTVKWRNRRAPDRWRIPQSFSQILCTVHQGNNEPVYVHTVLRWRSDLVQGLQLWLVSCDSPGHFRPKTKLPGMVLEPIQSGGEVIYGCAQFVQIKWLWENRLHVQPLVGFADFR